MNNKYKQKKWGNKLIQQIIKKINCPNCTTENEVILWEKININMNPDLKEKLFDESINNLECKNCGYKSRIDIPLYYNDAKKHYFIYLVSDFPVGKEEEDKLIKTLNDKTMTILNQEYNNKVRVVFEYYNLLEKINIFEAGLDDRAIEGCKILARTQLKLLEGRGAFAGIEGDKLIFNFFEKEDKEAVKSFEIPKAMYEEVKQLIENKDKENGHSFRIIDVKYAVSMLMN